MAAPLTNKQKAYLSRLARDAWQTNPDADALDEASFRRAEVARACGKAGLRCCSQDDYGAVKGRFLDLLGRPDEALRAMVHGHPASNQRRVVEAKIFRALNDLGQGLSYAEGICRQMTRGAESLTSAEPRTLWKVFFALQYQAKNAQNGERRTKNAADSALRTPHSALKYAHTN
jgi:hypothetical protein